MGASESPAFSARPVAWRIAIALAQGGLLWFLYDAAANDRWPEEQRGWLIGLIAAGVLVPLAQYLVADLAPAARQWPALAGLALLSLALGWHHGAWSANEPYRDLSFPLALGVLVFHALPFVQSALTRGTARPRYATLFHFAWRNALQGALGALFAGVFWLLLMLWGQLFHMLGIDVFRELFEASAFAIPATTVAVGIGVQLAGSVERLQGALRQQLLALLKWLAPLAIFILALFTLTLLAKSPELFAEQRRAISAVWLLWLVALSVALLNAAYQDGSDASPYPRWLGTAVRFASILLLPVAVLAVYALGVRIESYGLTASRGWGLLVGVVALGYAGGYAWAALRRGAWMAGMGAVNVAIAMFTIVAMMLMLTPPLSPERLAAASQFRRVLADPEADAYADLRFRTGRYGRDRLAVLAAIEDHPQSADIGRRARSALEMKSPWFGPAPAGDLAPGSLVPRPAGVVLEPALIAVFNDPDHRHVLSECTTRAPCRVLFADLNGDESEEAILFGHNGLVGATRGERGWRPLNWLPNFGRSGRAYDWQAATRALDRGSWQVRDLPWRAVEIDGEYFVLADPRAEDPPCPPPDEDVSRGAAKGPACP